MELEHLDSMLVATLRHQGEHTPDATSGTWQDLIVWASSRRLLGRRADVRGIGLLWDDPHALPRTARRYDTGIPIDPVDVPDVSEPVHVLRTMPGAYLRVEHEGDYALLPVTYERAIDVTLRASGLTLAAAPALELYRNSAAEVPVDELRTSLFLPVVRA